MSSARITGFGLVVEDLPRSLAFYRELGVDVPEVDAHTPHAEAELANRGKMLWDTVEVVRGFVPDWKAPDGGHRIALTVELDTPAEVDAEYERIGSLGYECHTPPWDAVWGQRYALVLDPDGNVVELFAPLDK